MTFTANVQNANGDVQWSCEETSWKATGNQVEFTANEAGTYHIHAVNNGADAVFTLHVNAGVERGDRIGIILSLIHI